MVGNAAKFVPGLGDCHLNGTTIFRRVKAVAEIYGGVLTTKVDMHEDTFETMRDIFAEEIEASRFRVGDGVRWAAGTDCCAGTVVKVTPKSVIVVEDEAKLLNGFSSGEPDALKFTPGGFVGHTSGTQRYEFSPGNGPELRFTLRKTGLFKLAGTPVGGSMRGWGNLYKGRRKYYDYNF